MFLLLISIFFSHYFDLVFYFYFIDIDKSLNLIFLKNFFNNITIFGDSFWYFSFCILGIAVIHILEKTKLLISTNFKEVKKIFFYIITCLFLTGFFTQLLKHIIGRARPNHTIQGGSLNFHFFTIPQANKCRHMSRWYTGQTYKVTVSEMMALLGVWSPLSIVLILVSVSRKYLWIASSGVLQWRGGPEGASTESCEPVSGVDSYA